MNLAERLNTPGDHALSLTALAGHVDAYLLVPEHMDTRYIALLGHPHSLQGGSMTNKVVTTLARVFKELGIASLRFNFRGVGLSAGIYDAGVGESEDMLHLACLFREINPALKFCFAGFSFGSYVAYRAAAQFGADVLVTIAPAVNHYDYTVYAPRPTPWILVHGEDDEVVPFAEVVAFAEQQQLPLIRFPATGHFFHSKLLLLKDALLAQLKRVLLCS